MCFGPPPNKGGNEETQGRQEDGGKDPGFNADVTRLLRQAILVGIPKGDDGVRPLALGEALVKVGVKILLAMDKGLKDDVAVGDFRRAFKPDGCAQITHQVRELLRADPSEHAILVDCKNAFNSALVRYAVAHPQRSAFDMLHFISFGISIARRGHADAVRGVYAKWAK